MVLGLKNKDSITKIWMSLKDEIEKGKPLSAKWYEKADLKELKDVKGFCSEGISESESQHGNQKPYVGSSAKTR